MWNCTEALFYLLICSIFRICKHSFYLECVILAKRKGPTLFWRNLNLFFTKSRPLKTLLFIFKVSSFFKIKTNFLKNLIKRLPVFMKNSQGSYKIVLRHRVLWCRNSPQQNDGSLKILQNLHKSPFSLLVFTKSKKCGKVLYSDMRLLS